eukprot:4591353-Prymnesium_polylepis.1
MRPACWCNGEDEHSPPKRLSSQATGTHSSSHGPSEEEGDAPRMTGDVRPRTMSHFGTHGASLIACKGLLDPRPRAGAPKTK